MDYKLYCHNHQYEQIINFCADRNFYSTQLSVSADFAPPASVNIHEPIYKEELLLNMKILKIPMLAIIKGSDSRFTQSKKTKNGWYS